MSAGPHAGARPPLPGQPVGQPPLDTGAQRAAARAHPVAESVPGRLAGISAGQVMGWQVAVAAVLVAAVRRDWTLPVAAAGAAAVFALTGLRRRGRWLYQRIAVRLRLRARGRGRSAEPGIDPRLAALRELVPALEITGITLRSGERIGVAFDGQCWIGVVAVQPVEEVLPRAQRVPWVPVGSLVQALRVDDIALAGVQVLRYSAPAPAGLLPANSPVAASYAQLNARRVPAGQHVWVALRLDPVLCPDAVQARGGGQEGGQRAVKRCVARVLELLDAAGVPARALDEEALRLALALSGGVRALPAPPSTRRTNESWTHWQGDGTVHVAWWVRTWPARAVPVQALAEVAGSVPALAATVSLTLHPVQTEGARFRAFVRLAAVSPAAAGAAAQAMERAAAAAGIGLYRLDGEQGLGVLATLPLGGGSL
jgi:type VII secretion protein EccE